MNISGLVVHPEGLEKLKNIISEPPHALLLSGGLGTGKTHIGRWLAAQLLDVQSLENQPYYREVVAMKDAITIRWTESQ